MSDFQTSEWTVDGKDGNAILVVNEKSDLDGPDGQYLRVYGPGREIFAVSVARACTEYSALVKALHFALQGKEHAPSCAINTTADSSHDAQCTCGLAEALATLQRNSIE